MKAASTALHYEIAGTGETIILGHAGFVDSRMWDTQWAALSKKYRVIRFDMQGYGKSGVATQSISRSEELLGLMEALNIEKTHLVGSSMSGTAYLDFTLTYPEKVISLIIVNSAPSGFEMRGEPPRYLMKMFGALQQGNVDTASELQVRIWFDGMYRKPSEVKAKIRQKVAEMNKIAVQNQTFLIADMQPPNLLNPPAIERLGEVQCPVLVLDSTLDHPEINRAADLMASQIPNSIRHTIEDAAHVPNLEKPAIFNQLVLKFLG